MTAKSVLLCPHVPPCYATLFNKAISTRLRIHSSFLNDLEFTLNFLGLLLKEVALLFSPGEIWETSQIFSRTYRPKQNSRTFQDSKKIQVFSKMWQP